MQLFPVQLDQEFAALYGEECSARLCEGFPCLADLILERARTCGIKSIEHYVKEVINSNGGVTTAALMVLPYMLPPGVIKEGGKHKRPTAQEVQNHFIQEIEVRLSSCDTSDTL